jgi:mevalonate kinase
MKIFKFPSKVLLFGEYGIIKNSYGLVIPYNNYFGYLTFNSLLNKDVIVKLNMKLKKYYFFLIKKLNKYKLKNLFFLDVLYQDINRRGLYFNSNIPEKSGLGSSGSLIASLYNQYSVNKNIQDVFLLKKIFSVMESYYHGSSSGIDPLTSYLKKPILIRSLTMINTLSIPDYQHNYLTIFILHSGIYSSTYKMVRIFLRKYKNLKFKHSFHKYYIYYNRKSIIYFLEKQTNLLLNNVKNISIWQYINFIEMIPKDIIDIWRHGFLSNIYYLKLCGSGGGGCFLGFTYDYDYVKTYLCDFFIEKIDIFNENK